MKTKSTTPEGAWLLDVKVGDRVWVGKPTYGKASAHLREVIKRTKTIITVKAYGPINFRIEEWDTGEESTYHAPQSPKISFGDYILAVATPEECDEWDKKQLRERLQREENENALKVKEQKREELRKLFTDEAPKNVNSISVNDAEWGTQDERRDLFDVVFRGLTEQQVRTIATTPDDLCSAIDRLSAAVRELSIRDAARCQHFGADPISTWAEVNDACVAAEKAAKKARGQE